MQLYRELREQNVNAEKIGIRRAHSNDFRRILELSEESWPEWWSKNLKLGAEHIRLRIREKTVLVATANGRIVGYLICGTLWSILHIDDVFVEGGYRKNGLGSALLTRAVQDATKSGFRKIMSDSDYDNEIARRFHLKNRFRESGYMKNLWGKKDSIVFSRDLH